MTRPALSAIRAHLYANCPAEERDKLATKLSFMAASPEPNPIIRKKRQSTEKSERKKEEESLQIQLMSYLRTQPRITGWHNHVQVFNSKPSWAQLNYLGKLKRMGVRKGMPDIMLYFKGHGGCVFCAAEVKAKNGVVTEEQNEMLADVEDKGGYSAVVRSLDDLIGLLERAGYWK